MKKNHSAKPVTSHCTEMGVMMRSMILG